MKRLLLTMLALLVLAVALPLIHPSFAFADAKSDVCGGVSAASGASGCSSTGTSVNDIINAVVRILSIAAGVGGVIMVMVAGFRYITSGGDSSKVSSAKSALIYAVVGLIIAGMAQFIVQFVLDKAK